MALDQYSLCPCGNGKKIKFCKCHEHFSEIEKLDRMIHGEQYVAALDHINHLLKSLPSEPWLLAMKCEVLVHLKELEGIEEASAKFIRLQPDNPLAKMYRGLVAIMLDNAEEASSLVLQSLAATTGPLHPFFFTVSLNLIGLLSESRRFMTAIMHAELLLAISEGAEQVHEVAQRTYQSLISDSRISILQRELPPSPPSADDQPYAERYREAVALLEKHQLTQCRNKVDGMIREFGHQGPLLILRLNTQLYLAEVDSAAETCLRLAKTDGLSPAQQVYYQALAGELSPKKAGLQANFELVAYALEDEAEVERKMISSSRLHATQSEYAREFFKAISKEEVPPKHMYMVEKPFLSERFPENTPRLAGQWVAFMGKQTDKPARVIMLLPTLGPQAAWTQDVCQELGLDEAKRQVIQPLPVNVLSLFSVQVHVAKRLSSEQEAEFTQALRQLDQETFLDFKVPALNGETPRTAGNQPQYRTELLGLLLAWEASGHSKMDSKGFKDLHRILGLEQPKVDPSLDTFDLVGGASYFWTDLEAIDKDGLLQLAQSAIVRDVNSVMAELAEKIQQTAWPEDQFLSADYTRLSLEARSCRDLEKSEKLLHQLIEKGKVLKFVVGQMVMERCSILRTLQRAEEANEYFIANLQECPDDPILMQQFQMLMLQMQQAQGRGGSTSDSLNAALLGRGGSGRGPSPSSSSGLWTPGQPAASEPVGESSGSSGSGLWIPGQ
jgi:predicted Zn-dependent protease